MNSVPIINIVGPTAIGKTDCAIELTKRVSGEIISADSMAVYREFDIGTAKPSRLERQTAKFHLVDVADPSDDFNVSQFVELATAALNEIRLRDRAPFVVGGTGLYVKSLLDGYGHTKTPANAEIREVLKLTAAEHGTQFLHDMLTAVDPTSASRIHQNDLVRIVRALEVYQSTGVPISVQQAEDKRSATPLPCIKFGLFIGRDELNNRINSRVDKMIEGGLIDEVEQLKQRGYNEKCAPMRSLGYAEIWGMLQGEYGADEAIDLIKANTRKFAKRQMTWFRADNQTEWIDVTARSSNDVAEEIFRKLPTTYLAMA